MIPESQLLEPPEDPKLTATSEFSGFASVNSCGSRAEVGAGGETFGCSAELELRKQRRTLRPEERR